ncbi:MAG TPA: hypothetical protein PK971_05085 [Saprospiraceae bacterium]|nr:hypothetical protein [Saprospiraceae bacterium]
MGLSAQEDNLDLTVRLRTAQGDVFFKRGPCGFDITAPSAAWGAALSSDVCGAPKWAQDSLACDPLSNSLAGNVALIRRKDCHFGMKASHAQAAGAKAVIILNHFDSTSDTDCTVVMMDSKEDAIPPIVIPVIFASRHMANIIEQGLRSGTLIEVCFLPHTLRYPVAEFAYATPLSQRRDRLGPVVVMYTNRSKTTQHNVVLKAEVTDPSGAVKSLVTTLPQVGPNAYDTLVGFDGYQMPDLPGRYRVVYSSSAYTLPKDTVVREFVQTRYTYATDDLRPNGSTAPNLQQFRDAGYRYEVGSAVLTGPKGMTAEYVSFGLGNASDVAVGNPAADLVTVLLYDNDSNNDGVADMQETFWDLSVVAHGRYPFSHEKPDSLVYIKLESLMGDSAVLLQPNHLYMLTLVYDGNLAGTGKPLRFTCTDKVYYPHILSLGRRTPLLSDALYGGWNTATAVIRLHEKGFDPRLSEHW